MNNRGIHLIDIENLAGHSALTPASARWAAAGYRKEAELHRGDLVIIATSHRNAFAAAAAFPAARLLLGSGPDGADKKLLEVMREEALNVRFDRLVIGSGDGIFSFEAARLAAHMHVAAVGLPGHVAPRLRMACHATRYFGSHHDNFRMSA
ncbi:hypothetical protein AB4Y63_05465 [Leifsonia sp. YAF41]|uniref:hypothetical protein n=1 Tax=Leifsonia sp. YAF41 TaxID=3233086 RepID=UPI003F9505BA